MLRTQVRENVATNSSNKDFSASGKEPIATGLAVEKQTSLIIETAQACDIFVTGPGNLVSSNEAIPARCYQQKDKNLLDESKPLCMGHHKMEVLEQVSGSPDVCQVYDPTKVLVLGAEDRIATVVAPVVAINLLGQDLPTEVASVPGGEGDLIEFSPSVAGRYKLSLTYDGEEEVPGSTLVFTVQEDRTRTVFGKGLTLGQVSDVAILKIDGRGLEGVPRVEVQGSSSTVLLEDEEETGLYNVKYVPEEVGHMAVHVFFNNTDISGSPLHVRICDSTVVKPMGGCEGVLDLNTVRMEMLGEERLIKLDVSKDGPGSMDIELQGPVSDHRLDNAGPCEIKFVFIPRKEGTFTLTTKWNGALLRTVQVVVRPSKPQQQRTSGRVVLTGKGLVSATCGERSIFGIDGSEGGDGEPVSVVSLSGIDSTIRVSCRAVSHNIREASFIPARPGTCMPNVTWAGGLVKEGLLKVGHASKVICSGEGLRIGTMGSDLSRNIRGWSGLRCQAMAFKQRYRLF